MRIRVVIFILCLGVKVSQAQSPVPDLKKYPTYEAVVQHFKANYSTAFDTKFKVQFARKPFGWYVEIYDITKSMSKPAQSHLLWSYNRKQYQQIALKAASKDDNPYWQPYEYEYEQESFRIHPFFGYLDWSADVCEIFAPLRDLNDTMLYGVGRAYSHLASRCLWNYASFSEPTRYDSTFSKGDIHPDSVNRFIQLEWLAISFFKKTMEKTPSFNTKVGNINTKYSNEYLYAYLVLSTMGFNQEAQQFLTEGLYDEFILATARNMLRSCPEDALLITGGDNDTYSLLYVQALEKLRPDVIVAAGSLTNYGRYVHYLRSQYNLLLTIPDIQYAKLQYGYVLLDQKKEAVICEEALQSIAQAKTVNPIDPIRLPADKIFLTFSGVDNNDMERLYTLSVDFSQGYLYNSDIFILDFLYNQYNQRTLCFANTCPKYMYENYSSYLEPSGFVYQLFIGNKQQEEHIVAHRMEKLLLNEYEYRFYHRDHKTFDRFITNYKMQFLYGINLSIRNGDTAQAKRLAAKYLEVFTKHVLPYGDIEAHLLEMLISLKMYEQANAVCEELLNEANKFIKSELSATWERIPDESGVALWIYVCNTIKNIEDKNIQLIWKKKAEIYYDTLLPFYH